MRRFRPRYFISEIKVIKFYRAFFYGDELTEIEKEIEYRYLQQK